MIKATRRNNKVNVEINGSAMELSEELSSIIRFVKKSITREFSEELAEMLIVLAGRMAFAKSESEMDAAVKMFTDWIDDMPDEKLKELVE